MRRTNYCETCPGGSANVKGASQIFWSPSQRYISHTAFVPITDTTVACKVFIVPSDPKDGNTRTQFTFVPAASHDYDPSWSPLNTLIAFDRDDRTVIRKGLPWSGDTTEVIVTTSNNPGCNATQGDDIPAISPDGQWVAFSRCMGDLGGWAVWKVPITGGSATELYDAADGSTNFYTSWSPDGQTIYFQHAATAGAWELWKVPASGGTSGRVFAAPFAPPDTLDAVTPAPSPDGKVLTLGYGRRDWLVRNVVTHTLDLSLASPTPAKLIPNYPDTAFAEKSNFPILSPRLSPDGTRLALGSKQVWAARRNMNLPPVITAIQRTSPSPLTYAVNDTTPTLLDVFVQHGQNYIFQIVASDPEGDPITYNTYFKQSWMSGDGGTQPLVVNAPPPPPYEYTVVFKVTTPSGGSDQLACKFAVDRVLGARSAIVEAAAGSLEGPNPTRGRFVLMAPLVRSATTTLSVFDMSGRRVMMIKGAPGTPLVWEGKDRTGAIVPAGVYLYRMEAGKLRRDGKIVMLR